MKTFAGAVARTNETDGMPIAFSGCFGWLHMGVGDIGIVICPGIGRDAWLSHSTLRRLAIELARAGYLALRFDYPSTGDSKDLHAADPSIGWMAGVDDAISFLRGSGVRRIVLCGFRLGALLALLKSATHKDVDDVVMIDPVTSGALFLREIGIGAGQQSPSGQTLEVDGETLANGPASPLHGLNCFSLTSKPVERVLILTSSTSRNANRLASHMGGLGVDVTQAEFKPLREHDSEGYVVPATGLAVIRHWLPATIEDESRAAWCPSIDATLGDDNFLERPLRFGSGLFGTLCCPRAEGQQGCVVVIGNSGAGPRYGYARFHVFLARRLAAEGVASLRFDFAGLGDSSPLASGAGAHVYETDRGPDIRAAIDVLERLGYCRFVTAGICSGSYHAWRATLHDERIDTLLMVNPATFSWRDGQSLGTMIHTSAHSTRYYLSTMSRGSGWKRLLSRQLDVRRALRTIRAQTTRRLSGAIGNVAGLVGWPTQSSTPFRTMRKLSRRGVRVLIIMAADDAGLDVLSAHFGRYGHRLAKLRGAEVHIEANLDHSVTRRTMQKEVSGKMLDFLNAKPSQSQPTDGLKPETVAVPKVPLHEDVA